MNFWLGDIVSGAFIPVLAKHTKHLSLVDILSVGEDRMQRNFEPMRKQVEAWKGTRLLDDTAKLVIYRAFVEGKLDAPKHLARRVHDQYFDRKLKSSPREQCGACPTPSRARSRNSIRSRSSRQLRS